MAAYPGNTTPQNADDQQLTLKKILLALIGGGPGGGIPTVPSSGSGSITPHFLAPVASSTTIIPVGAINASVLILTGTGTLNGVDQPVGAPWTEPNKLASTVTLVLANPGTARVYYGT